MTRSLVRFRQEAEFLLIVCFCWSLVLFFHAAHVHSELLRIFSTSLTPSFPLFAMVHKFINRILWMNLLSHAIGRESDFWSTFIFSHCWHTSLNSWEDKQARFWDSSSGQSGCMRTGRYNIHLRYPSTCRKYLHHVARDGKQLQYLQAMNDAQKCIEWRSISMLASLRGLRCQRQYLKRCWQLCRTFKHKYRGVHGGASMSNERIVDGSRSQTGSEYERLSAIASTLCCVADIWWVPRLHG